MRHLRLVPAVVIGFLVAGLAALTCGASENQSYKSPYSVQFTHAVKELIGDLERGERGDLRRESSVPHEEWYSRRVREQFAAWGPPARHYLPAELARDKSLEWKRERAIAVAMRFIGYGYQHHHVPDWDPPKQWPWLKVKLGHNGKGVDCSNFTAFVYNQSFGIKPSGDVQEQAKELQFVGPGKGRTHRVLHIRLPENYDEFAKTLRTGDLLYIRNDRGVVAHVVLWVGPVGRSPDKVPLLIDSHGDDVTDCTGVAIPCGIHLRPFKKNSWYHRSAAHAIRVWHEE